MIEMEHRMTDHIGIEAAVSRVNADAEALIRKTVRFLFFPVKLGARVAVRMESDGARLRLGRGNDRVSSLPPIPAKKVGVPGGRRYHDAMNNKIFKSAMALVIAGRRQGRVR